MNKIKYTLLVIALIALVTIAFVGLSFMPKAGYLSLFIFMSCNFMAYELYLYIKEKCGKDINTGSPQES